jgi:hypothetical protein
MSALDPFVRPGSVSECERRSHWHLDPRRFHSNAVRNGRYRAIRVVARAAGHGRLLVRTGAGYIAQPEAREKNESIE